MSRDDRCVTVSFGGMVGGHKFIFEQTGMTTCIVQPNRLQSLYNLKKNGKIATLKNLIIIDYHQVNQDFLKNLL